MHILDENKFTRIGENTDIRKRWKKTEPAILLTACLLKSCDNLGKDDSFSEHLFFI